MFVYQTKKGQKPSYHSLNTKALIKQKSTVPVCQKMAQGSGHSIARMQIKPDKHQALAVNAQREQQQPAFIQKKENNRSLPGKLKSGIESLSGYSMDDVKVHYHSDKPAQLNAHAYAQGLNIHLASGQEKHLPHEAWHVVQQKQGRVKSVV